jgi:hypothetical protein
VDAKELIIDDPGDKAAHSNAKPAYRLRDTLYRYWLKRVSNNDAIEARNDGTRSPQKSAGLLSVTLFFCSSGISLCPELDDLLDQFVGDWLIRLNSAFPVGTGYIPMCFWNPFE